METPREPNPPEWVKRLREKGYEVSEVTCDTLPPPVTYPEPPRRSLLPRIAGRLRRLFSPRAAHAGRGANAAVP